MRRPRWGFGAFVVVEAAYLQLSVLLTLPFADSGPVHVWVIVLVVGVPSIVAAGLAVLITRLRGNGPRIDVRWTPSWRAVGLGLAFGFGGLVVTIPASLLWAFLMGEGANSAAGSLFGQVRADWAWAVIVFALIALIAPICEEIVYRGLLWGALDRRWGRWVAFGVTTVVFSVAHLEWTRIPLLLVVAVPIGLARLYSDSLIASIVAHQVTNLLPGAILMFTIAGALPSV
jgi:membrane protease YdiL (CAAX protease family)